MAESKQEIILGSEDVPALTPDVELNQQIVTARRFPRSEHVFVTTAKRLVLANEDTAGACIYALPRGGKTIEGPSARFAEILAFSWGNCRQGARVIRVEDKFLFAQGVFHDLERNVAYSVEVPRRITNRDGKRYDDDMIGVTGNAANSIALRNAVLKGIPSAVWHDIYYEARALIAGTFENLDRRRARAVHQFGIAGISEEVMLRVVGRKGIKDVTPEDLLTLRGLMTALREGDTNIDAIIRQYSDLAETAGQDRRGRPARADVSGKLNGGKKEAAKPAEPEHDKETGEIKDAKAQDAADAKAAAAELAKGDAVPLEQLKQELSDEERNAAQAEAARKARESAQGAPGSPTWDEPASDSGQTETRASEAPTGQGEAGHVQEGGAVAEPRWTEDQQKVLSNLAVALGSAADADDLAAIPEDFGAAMDLHGKEFEAHCWELILARTEKLGYDWPADSTAPVKKAEEQKRGRRTPGAAAKLL